MKKTNFKSSLLKTLICCFCIALSLSVVASCQTGTGNNQPTGNLSILNWQNETAEGILGSRFDVETLKAVDTSGKEYPVNISVKKLANGVEIPLIYNAFDLLSTGGYEIIYTAGSGNNIAVKKITVSVKDQATPVIIITGNNIAEVGEEYKYPTLNISDDSGEDCEISVKVYNEADQVVPSAENSFVPSQVGYYTLLVSALDKSGNAKTKTFELYARNTKTTGEVDAFDDEGLQFTAHSGVGAGAIYGEFTSFKHLTTSKGSAMFTSTKESATAIYLAPRLKAMDLGTLGDNLCITVSLYISDLSVESREVTVGTSTFTIETNKWVYLYVTEEHVSNLGRFITDVNTKTKPLLSVKNDGTAYQIFIDDVRVCTKTDSQLLSGLKTVYGQGGTLSYNVASGYTVDCYKDGKVQSLSNGSTLNIAGTYQLFARPTNGIGAVQVYEFSVGTLRIEIDSKEYAIGADNALPEIRVYNGKTLVSDASVTVYDFGLYTGEMTKLNGKVKPERVQFALYVEAEVSGKKVSGFTRCTAKYTADAYAYMGEGNGDWAPQDDDFMRQGSENRPEGSFYNLEIIDNYAYYIDSYGYAPAVKFDSLKAYMLEQSIETATIRILFAAPSVITYDFGDDKAVVHSGVKFKTGDLLTFENVKLEDISHVQVIWESSELYIMVELPAHLAVTANRVSFDLGEVTLDDNSASIFAGLSDLQCTVIAPNGEALEVLDGKFTATEKGNYKVKYQATNDNGKPVLGSYLIRCGYSAREFGMMWDFNDSNIVSNDTKESDGGLFYVKHHEELDGEKGVVEVKSNHNDWVWEANFLQGTHSLLEKVPSDCDTLFIRAKGANDFAFTLYAAYTNATHGDTLVCYSYPVTTEWQTFAISGENFNHFVTYFASYKNGLAMFLPAGVTLYISEFYVGKSIDITPNSSVAVGEVTLNDNSEQLLEGCAGIICEVTTPSGETLSVTNGKFNAEEDGIYTVTYFALNRETLYVGSYTLLCVSGVDNGSWTPVESDWNPAADILENPVRNIAIIPSIGWHVVSSNAAPFTKFDSLKAYMQANNIATVSIKILCVTESKIAINFYGEEVQSTYAAGSILTFEDIKITDTTYIQNLWTSMEYYVIIELPNN